MTVQNIKLFILAVGGILGTFSIGSVIYIYLRNQKIEKAGNLILLTGLVLLGLYVWQSFEFSAGQVTLKATSALETVKIAQSIEKVKLETFQHNDGNCEEERKMLLEELQKESYKRKQLDVLLANLESSLYDIAMKPIRNMR